MSSVPSSKSRKLYSRRKSTASSIAFRIDGKEIPRLHPTQKPVNLLKRLIEIFTNEVDVIVDPYARSGANLRAARDMNRDAYGFEISAEFYYKAVNQMLA